MTGLSSVRGKTPLIAALIAGFAILASPMAAAAQATTSSVPVSADATAPLGPEQLLSQEASGQRPPPLGADLFLGAAPSAEAARTVDDGYVMKPGDRVRVTLFGLVNQDQELTVDSQGNIVVPGVGPVRIAGLTAGQVPDAVSTASGRVYNAGVQVYAAPQAAAPVQVLVTGPVARPGAYAGASDDALVVYLQRAGGIDAERGSYRRIRVVRAGETIAQADIYDFLSDGVSPRIQFRNGDAIVVDDQGPVVSVGGAARSPFTFELESGSGLGAEIIRFARPRPEVTHVAVIGVRDGAPHSEYVMLEQFEAMELHDGDRVRFEADSRASEILVRVEGAHDGPSVFSMVRGTTVAQVLAQVAIDANADVETIHLRRESTRRTQRALLNESLARLERATFSQPARTPAEAAARNQSLSFVTAFIERARLVQPDGVLALSDQDLNQVRLETGDVIVIPSRSQVVTIAGEVQAPQSMLAVGNGTVPTYVRMAGGYTRRADRGEVLVFRQDGRIREGNRVQPGDRVLVPTKPDSTLIPLIRDITQTLFQMAGVFLVFDNNR
jgi:protein involved in polysaccharide export with SLBB domain